MVYYKISIVTTDNKNVGKIHEQIVPRKGEMILVDKHRYSIEQVLWSYKSPGKEYPEDPLSFYAVTIIVYQTV